MIANECFQENHLTKECPFVFDQILRRIMIDKDFSAISKDYYDSKEADEFHHHIFGGENNHIGMYDEKHTNVKDASRNIILAMTKKLPRIKKSSKMLDLGSGYGGAARVIAEEFGCKIECLNISETENKRNLAKTKKAGFDNLINITEGNFESIFFDHESFDLIWSQDALQHSNKKDKVFSELTWVLKPGGRFIFTDLLEGVDCPEGGLDELYDHFPAMSLGSVKSYKRLSLGGDLQNVYSKELPEQMINHCTKVLEIVKSQYKQVVKKSNEAFVKKTVKGIELMKEAGEKGHLSWGVMLFQKRNK